MSIELRNAMALILLDLWHSRQPYFLVNIQQYLYYDNGKHSVVVSAEIFLKNFKKFKLN